MTAYKTMEHISKVLLVIESLQEKSFSRTCMEDTKINRIEASNEQNNVAKMFSSRTLMGKFIAFAIRMATTQSPLSTDVGNNEDKYKTSENIIDHFII